MMGEKDCHWGINNQEDETAICTRMGKSEGKHTNDINLASSLQRYYLSKLSDSYFWIIKQNSKEIWKACIILTWLELIPVYSNLSDIDMLKICWDEIYLGKFVSRFQITPQCWISQLSNEPGKIFYFNNNQFSWPLNYRTGFAEKTEFKETEVKQTDFTQSCLAFSPYSSITFGPWLGWKDSSSIKI